MASTAMAGACFGIALHMRSATYQQSQADAANAMK